MPLFYRAKTISRFSRQPSSSWNTSRSSRALYFPPNTLKTLYWGRTKQLWSFSLLLCWLSWTCMCNTVLWRWVEEQPGLRRSSKLKTGHSFFWGPLLHSRKASWEKKQLWECTIKGWNSELQWMKLNNKMADSLNVPLNVISSLQVNYSEWLFN